MTFTIQSSGGPNETKLRIEGYKGKEGTGGAGQDAMKNETFPLRLRRGAIQASTDTLSVGASLDVSSARRFARAIGRFANRSLSHVIVDMSKTQTVDSSGFGTLISGLKKLGDSGATPLVVCSNPTVRRLMDFAGVSRMFTVIDRMSDARRVLAAATADALAS